MEGQTYLTFNPNLAAQSCVKDVPAEAAASPASENSEDAAAAAVVTPAEGKLPLQYNWVIWEQVKGTASQASDYKATTRVLERFSTVEGFWQHFHGLPQPSELMTTKRMMRDTSGETPVDAIMIFRDGVEPMWEDPFNQRGGHLDYKISSGTTAPVVADEYWNNLVLGMVGGTLQPADMVAGVRLVDKMERHKMIRFELWYTDYNKTEKRDALKASANDIMATKINGSKGEGLVPTEKPHSSQGHGKRR